MQHRHQAPRWVQAAARTRYLNCTSDLYALHIMQSNLYNKYFNHVHSFPRNNYCWMKARCQIRGFKLEKLWPCMYCKKGYLVTFVLLTGLNASCFVEENRLCSCEMPTSKSKNAVARNMKMQPWRNPCWDTLVHLRQTP